MPTKREKDEATGRETTGHEWDGIKELDTPLPSWWVWIFIATIVWSIGYMVFYPALPGLSDATDGVLGWSSRTELAEELAARDAGRADVYARIATSDFSDITNDRMLMTYALRGGESAFGDNCVPCHGAGGAGRPGGYPVLADDDWIWGGTLAAIDGTIRGGVRSGHDDERFSEMPGFAEILTRQERLAIVDYVLILGGVDIDSADVADGKANYLEHCASCHGRIGEGNVDLGAPALNDAIWLYGDEPEVIAQRVAEPVHGVMPAWDGRLDDATLKMLALYVYSLGGGTVE